MIEQLASKPREFQEALSIKDQAESLSPTSRARFLATLENGLYTDTESQGMLLRFYSIADQIVILEALETQTGGPLLAYRGRMVPNPLRKLIVEQYRESGRYFRLLGLDQGPRDDDPSQGKFSFA